MSTLELKDITNLPPNLPFSHIPQPQLTATNPVVLPSHGHSTTVAASLQNVQGQPPFAHPQHRRLHALSGNDSGCEFQMDDSLTDMQWLQRMDAGSDFPGLAHGQCRKKLAGKGSRSLGKDGCRKKLEYSTKKGTNKPPLSYASLIALAICSTPQRMMTLSSIYRWIEYTFPFYRTPEAKAWKNSIRHNLSIRKNMFMKVYQYPPRRGNGSYWTLLSDGEEELKKAVPLFATLQPPVIDPNCAYHKQPSTHTVKSKGKYVPVLPRSDLGGGSSSGGGLPYFSVGPTAPGSSPCLAAEEEVVSGGDESVYGDGVSSRFGGGGGRTRDGVRAGNKRPRHLSDHSYAKSWELEGGRIGTKGGGRKGDGDAKVVELAVGRGGGGSVRGRGGGGGEEGSESEDSVTDLSATPKRKCKMESTKAKPISTNDAAPTAGVTTKPDHSPSFTTPPKELDNSLHLLDSSFLTPLKNFVVPDVEIGTISFSPLYSNLITPKREDISVSGGLSSTAVGGGGGPAHSSFFPSPLTPLKSSLDSGIFSPLRGATDASGVGVGLGGVKFSTPTPTRMHHQHHCSSLALSPLVDLSTLSSLQPELCPLRVLESSEGPGDTPLRPGSLQAFGLPGLTPPSRD